MVFTFKSPNLRVQHRFGRMQDAGCRMQDAGCRMQDAGCRMQDAGCRMQDESKNGGGWGMTEILMVECGIKMDSKTWISSINFHRQDKGQDR